MSTAARRHLRVVVTPEEAEQAPVEMAWQAGRIGAKPCDVCGQPVDPAALVPALPDRHPTCVPAKRSLRVVWGGQR